MNNFYWFVSYEPVTKIYSITDLFGSDVYGCFYEKSDAERLIKAHNESINKIKKVNKYALPIT